MGGSGCHALSLPVVCVCVCVWCLTPVPHVTRVHGPRRARAVEALSGVPPTHHAGILSTGVCMRDPAALLPLSLPLALLHVPGMSRLGNQPFGRTRDMWALSAVPVPAGEPLACEGDAGRRGLPQSHDMAAAEWEEAMHCKHPGSTCRALAALSKTALDPSARKSSPKSSSAPRLRHPFPPTKPTLPART